MVKAKFSLNGQIITVMSLQLSPIPLIERLGEIKKDRIGYVIAFQSIAEQPFRLKHWISGAKS